MEGEATVETLEAIAERKAQQSRAENERRLQEEKERAARANKAGAGSSPDMRVQEPDVPLDGHGEVAPGGSAAQGDTQNGTDSGEDGTRDDSEDGESENGR